jgi:regulatory protein YycI of two-component signal transduction system YycFG
MIYFIIFVLLIINIWLSYEFYRAPYMDDNGNIIKKKNDIATKSNDTNNQEI